MSITNDTEHEVTFDMRFHAFVLAAPRNGATGIGMPSVVMNGGDQPSLIAALRAIADDLETNGGTEVAL